MSEGQFRKAIKAEISEHVKDAEGIRVILYMLDLRYGTMAWNDERTLYNYTLQQTIDDNLYMDAYSTDLPTMAKLIWDDISDSPDYSNIDESKIFFIHWKYNKYDDREYIPELNLGDTINIYPKGMATFDEHVERYDIDKPSIDDVLKYLKSVYFNPKWK